MTTGSKNMPMPRVFIGSSSEGVRLAEAAFAHLSAETLPKLWTNQLFLPGRYPMEVLEKQLRENSFAVLVASPDDEIVKRGAESAAMRDNVLFEFGLFSGALGRRRTFFICPSSPPINLPSDLFGIVTATYDASRVSGAASEVSTALQIACQQIRAVIAEEWIAIQKAEDDKLQELKKSREIQAVMRLNTVATRLRDTLLAVQRDALLALSDRDAFELVKKRAAEDVGNIAKALADDAQNVGVAQELDQLREAATEALLDLPFPQELSLGVQASRQKAFGIGVGALDTFLRGGDPVRHVQDAAANEAGGRLSSLGKRYGEWWERYSPHLQAATAAMQDRLVFVLLRLSSRPAALERSN
jgi:hypothetical protein